MAVGLILCRAVFADEAVQLIKIAYFAQETLPPPALSNLDPFIKNKGLPGAELGIADNNTTGQFTKQSYRLEPVLVSEGADVIGNFQEKIAGRYAFAVVNLPVAQLIKIAEIAKDDRILLFDATSSDDNLRQRQCQANMLHILPSRSMRTDALAQYMLKKRWQKWFLIIGPSEADGLYASAIKRSAKRFGMKIVAEKVWNYTYDARRTAQSEVPVFTQGEDYDILVVADEQGLFGEYFDYRTWLPRPVMGTQGLVATAWHRTHEQWGAVQIQNRFKEYTGRWMEEQDYGAYLAVRAIGEAATRTHSDQPEAIKAYLLSERFALQGYKGKPLSFRPWNNQLRQPILLAAPKSLVAVAPMEGFMHPKTELDTLGYDQPESHCPIQESK
ncbi:MAG: ABC transporter substrate-binding protein, partial [Gammaproteobacteria bacterium]